MASLLKRTQDPLCKTLGLERYSVVLDAIKPKVRNLITENNFQVHFTDGEIIEAADSRSEHFCDEIIEGIFQSRIKITDHTVAVAIAELFPDRKDSLVVH